MLEHTASNGKYQNIEHQVVVNGMKERMSIATIELPDRLGTMGPLSQVISGGNENYIIHVASLLRILYKGFYITSSREGVTLKGLR